MVRQLFRQLFRWRERDWWGTETAVCQATVEKERMTNLGLALRSIATPNLADNAEPARLQQ